MAKIYIRNNWNVLPISFNRFTAILICSAFTIAKLEDGAMTRISSPCFN